MADRPRSSLSFKSTDGLPVQVYEWLPDDDGAVARPPRAVVQIVHGMAEHAARYDALAQRLVASGYAVVAHDQRGHGATAEGGELGHMADDDGWRLAVADAHALNRRIAERFAAPVAVLGHSMGSFIAQQLAYEHPHDVQALVLSASNGKPPPIATAGRGVARLERLRLGKRGHSPVLHALSFEDFNKRFAPTRTSFDWLSRDEQEVDRYVDDPWCGFQVSTQFWVDMLDALPLLTRPDNLARLPKDLPIYAFCGSRDPVADFGRGVERLVGSYRAAWLTDVTHRIYPDGRHEMFHELNQADVFDDVCRWLDARFPASS